jgi:TetR/AcrR family transcriptional regulator, regulator of autoinduction and epiphytic fitness
LAKPLKAKRKYDSSHRQAQARQTRAQILAAARRLFDRRGYAGATIEAIAGEAEVAPETVFAVLGSKRALLAALIADSVGGDDRPIPLLSRPGPHAVLGEADPRTQVRLFAEDISQILARVAPLFAVMRAAAKTEPEIAVLLRNVLDERLRGMAAFVRSLASHGPLRPGLNVSRAAELVWTLTSPELYSLLTVDRGWPIGQYVEWLSEILVRELLP